MVFGWLPERRREELSRLVVPPEAPLLWTVDLDRGAPWSPLDAAARSGHDAEVCLVVRRPGGVLVCRRAAFPDGVFRLPRGPLLPGEPVAEAVRRAGVAEVGLDARPLRLVVAIAYRERTAGAPPGLPAYHTFAVLCDTAGIGGVPSPPAPPAPPAPADTAVQVLPVEHLPALADALDGVRAAGAREWEAWGHWRAHVHRAVWGALSGPPV